MSSTQWLTNRVSASFDLFAVSDYVLSPFGAGNRQLVFNGPVKADVVFAYEHPLSDRHRIEFYGKVENILNKRLFEDGFMGPGAWALGGLRLKY